MTGLAPPALLQTDLHDETLRVFGTGFTPETTVTFHGVAVATRFDSPVQLTSTIPAALLGSPGVFDLIVTTPPACSAKRQIAVRTPSSLAATGWPRCHHDNQNTSTTTAVVPASPTLRWKQYTSAPAAGVVSEGGGFWSAPVTAQDPGELAPENVFVGAPDGTVFSFGPDGAERYHFTDVGANPYGVIAAGTVRSDGMLYVGNSDAFLYAIKPDGSLAWRYSTGATSDADSAITEDGTILYASDDGKVYALNPDGTLRWSSAAAGEVDASIATSVQLFGELMSEIRVFVGGEKGWYCLSGDDGAEIWHVPAGGGRQAVVSSPVVATDGTVYGIDSGGTMVAIDQAGSVRWTRTLAGGPGATPALVFDRLYVVAGDDELHALSTANGETLWMAPVPGAAPSGGISATPSVDGTGNVFVFGWDGAVHRFAPDGTKLAAIPVSPELHQFLMPQVAVGADGALYVSGTDQFLYALH